MKKLIAILLTLALAASFAACNSAPASTTAPIQNNNEADATTQAADSSDETNAATQPAAAAEDFYFMLADVKLVPGAAFDPTALPEANDKFEVPSCAIEGTDNVYSYDTVELTAYNDGNGEVIYSIYIIDIDTPTTEGLYLGDDRATVEDIYGTDYEDNSGELVFTRGLTQLRILVDDTDQVVSLEYYMVTE